MTARAGESIVRHCMTSATQLADSIVRCIDANDLRQGLALCEQLNRQHPGYAYGWYLASFLMKKARNPRDALRAIERALALEPADKFLLQKAKCLVEIGDAAAAKVAVAALQFPAQGDAWLHSELGSLHLQFGQYERALMHCSRAAELDRGNPEFRYNEAALQRYFGDVEAAEAGFDAVIALDGTFYEAYNARAQLRTQCRDRNHVAQLEGAIARTSEPAGLVQLHFALAKEREDLGDFDAAFASLEQGASIKRRHMRYSVETDLAIIDRIRAVYGPAMFDGHIAGCPDSGPIFILGMPRTGTTLVERILDSHSAVRSAGELNHFALELTRLVKEMPRSAHPVRSAAGNQSRLDFVESTTRLSFERLGAAYLGSTRALAAGHDFLVDKLPFNFLYAGLIHLALPNARIVNLQRHPLDTCYAVYKQLFRDAYPFSYDLEELARYYVAYDRLMRHWNEVMPGVIHTLHYEALVADIEGETRRLLAFCGLPWEEGCVSFHENTRAATTASATQVRQPLYDSSVGKWRKVAAHMEPVRVILQHAGIRTD
jgi:tetratricopeptide (TPR) repeat protein